jgi:hypothetical protein
MNARLLAAFLCLTAASTGCIVIDNDHDHDHDHPPAQRGDVTFLWTFGSTGAGRCSDYPEIKKVRITIPGETLHNGGIYACSTSGTDGITLHDFAPKSYTYTIEGLDYDNQPLYKGSGAFTVNGNVREDINLTPISSPTSYAYVSWRFPANTNSSNPNCTQAGVTHVDVRIDSGEWTRLGCAEGASASGQSIESPYLAPGTHTIEFVGVYVSGSAATPYYYGSGTLTTQAGNPVSADYSLWAVGGMALRWELIDGDGGNTCTQAGLTQVAIHLYDEQRDEYVYGTTGDVQRCDGAPIIYRFLRPGNYKVIVEGSGSGGVYTNRSSPVSMTVTAYQQKTEGDAYTVYMYKQ